MALDNIKKTENFFVEGSGTAVILGDNDKLNLIHLQNMTLELTSTMENIYGGESNFSLYSYNTEKGAKITFTNASWNLDIMNLTQGTSSDAAAELFAEETVNVETDGTVAVAHNSIIWDSALVYDENNSLVPITTHTSGSSSQSCNVGATYANKTVTILYRYTLSGDDAGKGISTSLYTTGVPGFVTIYHKSKPMKQKNGRIIRLYTTIYKARCDGQLNFDFQHKNAFAPELTFDCVDPEREDGKYLTIAVKDTTVEDADNRNTVQGN